jgi:hypothetical protein
METTRLRYHPSKTKETVRFSAGFKRNKARPL